MKANLVTIELLTQDIAKSSEIGNKSWLLNSFLQMPENLAIAFLAASMKKDENLGRIFKELEPQRGKFHIELGAILHSWLPNLNEKRDYNLAVNINSKEKIQLSISNQMWRVNYQKKGQFAHALVPQYLFDKLKAEDKLPLPNDYHLEVLKSVVTSRFKISGKDAEDALEVNIDKCIEKFIAAINRVVTGQLILSTDTTPILNPVYARGSFDFLYLIMSGKDTKKLCAQRLLLSSFKAILKPPNYKKEKVNSFKKLIRDSQSISEIAYLISSGKGYLEAGLLRFALLQLVIAAELATSRFLNEVWRAAGISKKKIKNSANDITYSQMLNIHLLALFPEKMKPSKKVLAKLDSARTARNDLMHRGQFEMPLEELRAVYQATCDHLNSLNAILGANKLERLT